MRFSRSKILSIAAALIAFSFAGYQIFSIKNSALQMLADERARRLEHNRVTFEKKHLTPHASPKVQIIQSISFVKDFVRFRDAFFAAIDGGLAQYDEAGNLLKHFTVLDGLPESDLTVLSVFQDKLFIGTRTKSLLTFDGKDFEQFIFPEGEIQSVTSLFSNDSEIFVGTMKGGLLKFDGTNFTEIKADDKRISAINFVQKTDEKLFIGTFDNGLWLHEADGWTHFTTGENVPSNRVVGVVSQGARTIVATDFGLAEVQAKSVRQVAVLPTISSIIWHENKIFLTKDNGKIFTFENSLKELSGTENLQNARLISADERLFLLSNQGVSTIKNSKVKPFNERENNAPTNNFVSALTFDRRGNLWSGYFRDGIDVFAATGKKIKHLESEQTREINFLQADNETVSAATSGGLQTFKQDFSFDNLTKNEGLPSNSVTHFSGAFLATGKGLVIRQNGKIRVLSSVQNLPNNAVYTTLETNGKLYAGTLGGLAEIENNRVVRVFKDSNSNLRTNWVTALTAINERIFIGTYGGGVFELLPSGEIRSFETEAGKFVVNPNAFFTDGERLYAGTLSGVKILDLETQTWQTVKEILPAETVMSITGNDEKIYFGTSNGIAIVEKDYFE